MFGQRAGGVGWLPGGTGRRRCLAGRAGEGGRKGRNTVTLGVVGKLE